MVSESKILSTFPLFIHKSIKYSFSPQIDCWSRWMLLNYPNLVLSSIISTSDSKLLIKLPKCMFFFVSLINRAENPIKSKNIHFPLKWTYSTQNTQNECTINLTQFSLLLFTYSKCFQKSPNSKHRNLVEN